MRGQSNTARRFWRNVRIAVSSRRVMIAAMECVSASVCYGSGAAITALPVDSMQHNILVVAVSVFENLAAAVLTFMRHSGTTECPAGVFALELGLSFSCVMVGMMVGFRSIGVVITIAIATSAVAGVLFNPLRVAFVLACIREDDVIRITTSVHDFTSHVVSTRGGDIVMCNRGFPTLHHEKDLWIYAHWQVHWHVERGIPRTETVDAARSVLELMRRALEGQMYADATCVAIRADMDRLTGLLFRLEKPARIIQRAWRRAWADPGFALCRARLMREADELAATCIFITVVVS